MRKLIIILLILSSQLSHSQMIPDDKQKHLAMGALIGGLGNLVMYSESYKPKRALWFGIISGTLIGIAKESYDEYNYKGWDNKDLAFTISGAVLTSVPLYFWEKQHVKRYNKRMEALKIK